VASRAKGRERQRHRACEVDAHQEGRESDVAAEGIFEKKMLMASCLSFPQKADSQISSHSPRFVWDNLRHPVGRSLLPEVLEIST